MAPGQQALTLADDSMLEIHIPLDSRDARRWLQFSGSCKHRGTAWFAGQVPETCNIRWTEASGNPTWQGQLHLVVRFDQHTRTLTVAVRIDSANAAGNGTHGLPLVEGMFCAVDIPGKTLKSDRRNLKKCKLIFARTLSQKLGTIKNAARLSCKRKVFILKYKTFNLEYAMAMRRFLLPLLLSPVIIVINCASSQLIRFENNIQSMSNAELINCYHGINDRIKDVENSIGKDESVDLPQNQKIISHQTYFIGGEIYGLMQKEQLVLEEMKKRNLSP